MMIVIKSLKPRPWKTKNIIFNIITALTYKPMWHVSCLYIIENLQEHGPTQVISSCINLTKRGYASCVWLNLDWSLNLRLIMQHVYVIYCSFGGQMWFIILFIWNTKHREGMVVGTSIDNFRGGNWAGAG